MKEIPRTSFSKTNKVAIDFEIFTLTSLFKRNEQLEHPLEKPHRIEFYLILYITKGSGIHFIDFHPYAFSEGSLLFVSKGQVHAFEVKPDRDGFLILFTEAFLTKTLIHSDILPYSRLYNYHLYPPIIKSEQSDENLICNIVNEIHAEYNGSDHFAKEEMLRVLLQFVLLKAEHKRHSLLPKNTNSEWLIKFDIFRTQLEKHVAETRNANEFADMMGISYKHLNTICKSIAGSTAKELIDNYLILEIKRQLAISDISVKELAYELGFDEPTNFTKYFKKHTNYSPAQFRKHLTT